MGPYLTLVLPKGKSGEPTPILGGGRPCGCANKENGKPQGPGRLCSFERDPEATCRGCAMEEGPWLLHAEVMALELGAAGFQVFCVLGLPQRQRLGGWVAGGLGDAGEWFGNRVVRWFGDVGGWAVGRLGGWAVGRLGGWAVGRLGGWAVGRLGGWAVGRLSGWAVGRLGGWAVGRLGGWVMWVVGWLGLDDSMVR